MRIQLRLLWHIVCLIGSDSSQKRTVLYWSNIPLKGSIMKLKFAGMAMVAFAVVISQSTPSEAGHHHRKSRICRAHVMAQTPVYNYDVASVSTYSNGSNCGCASVESSYGDAVNVRQVGNPSGYGPGYMHGQSSGYNTNVDVNALNNSRIPQAGFSGHIGAGR
jgi:hypothetical protein